MSEEELYTGREQTLVKHLILRKYLERFARIVGTFSESITYVDCFSGPWNVRSEKLEDSSFAIALQELRKARGYLETRGRSLNLRCMFLEKDPTAYAKLKEFANQVRDAEVETKSKELAAAIQDILQFVKKGGRWSFPFIFIDPTGWTGFEMNLIQPLLKLKPGEVLINFMTEHIRRFIESPQRQTQESFAALFGSAEYKAKIQALSDPQEREDALFSAYAENVRKTGGYPYTCAAIVLHPDIDRSYFHLIYATRDPKGVKVFKEVERKATEVMEETQAGAKKRKREKKTGQRELFSGDVLSPTRPVERLRDRYLSQARDNILGLLRTGNRVPFEKAWEQALSLPLVWESDLKDWVRKWQAEGLQVEGMKPRQKVPQQGQGITLFWPAPPRS